MYQKKFCTKTSLALVLIVPQDSSEVLEVL